MTSTIVAVSAVECGLIDAGWGFATEQAAAIDQHWQTRRASNPHLFNGPVLLLRDGSVETDPDGQTVFRGHCFQADFKSFMAWREFGHPETGVRNIFSMAALETSDGAFVLGEMAPHTAPAGQIYFPSGTPDPTDVKGGRVDIEGSAARELGEETGLGPADVSFIPGMILVVDPVRVCCMKRVQTGTSADATVSRIHAWLSRQKQPELARMHVVRSEADIRSAMPGFVRAYLHHMLAGDGQLLAKRTDETG